MIIILASEELDAEELDELENGEEDEELKLELLDESELEDELLCDDELRLDDEDEDRLEEDELPPPRLRKNRRCAGARSWGQSVTSLAIIPSARENGHVTKIAICWGLM